MATFFLLKLLRSMKNVFLNHLRKVWLPLKLKRNYIQNLRQNWKKVIDSNCNNCQNCTNCIKAHEAWENYKKQRNLTNKITKDNKRKNLVNDLKAKSSKNDLKGIWKSIKLAANLPTKSSTQDNIGKNLDAKN